MHRAITNVLFVSKTNACRSLLAEACLNQLGKGKLRGFSCGVPSKVADLPDTWTLLALQTAGVSVDGLRCKSWAEFTKNAAPRMNYVIGLDADGYSDLPAWPGQPVTALWDYPLVTKRTGRGTEVGLVAIQTLFSLRRRIELMVSLHARGKQYSDLQQDLRDMTHL
jgi:protein-tyrosine-phosphatase